MVGFAQKGLCSSAVKELGQVRIKCRQRQVIVCALRCYKVKSLRWGSVSPAVSQVQLVADIGRRRSGRDLSDVRDT